MYYLLALPYRLTGSHSVGMCVGALIINAVALAGITAIAWRRGGIPVLLFTTLGVTLVMHALGVDVLRDPWNPYITVLPFGLLLFLVWELSAGSLWALPAAAAAATFLVQTHVGYVPVALPLLLGGAAWLVLVRRRSATRDSATADWRRGVTRAGIVTAAVLVVLWLPPVIGMIRHEPGNLSTAARYFVHPKSHHRLLDGYRVVSKQFSARPEWVTGAHAPNPFTGEPDFVFHTAVPWLAVPFVLAGLVLWRRRIGEAMRLAAIVAVACGLGVLAVSRTIGPIYAYRLRWTWLLGMIAMVLVAWALWSTRRVQRPFESRVLLAPVALVIAALTVLNTVSAAQASTPARPMSTTLTKLVLPLVKALPKRDGVVIVSSTSFGSSFYLLGTVLWLERDGIPVRVPDGRDAAQGVGARRVYHGGPVRAFVTIADDSPFDDMAKDPTQTLVAYRGTLPPRERAILAAQRDALTAQYRRGALSARDLFTEAGVLGRRLGTAIGVFIRNDSPSTSRP
jgi:hypothetical protein